jgi:hypothetical protein
LSRRESRVGCHAQHPADHYSAEGWLHDSDPRWTILRGQDIKPAGEVHVSPGSDPERDDTGLPPVDVEIPDDARELDRDVQAYHREQRAQRRNQRSRRLHGVLSRDSMVVPLLVCCLVFALISGTLLTLFTATSIDQGMPGQGGAGALPAPVMTPAPRLASDTVIVSGSRKLVRQLGPAVLLMVPAKCSCTHQAWKIASFAQGAGVYGYVLYTGHSLAQARQLAGQLGHNIVPAQDVTGALDHGYQGLTAFIVTAQGSVSYFQRLETNQHLSELLLMTVRAAQVAVDQERSRPGLIKRECSMNRRPGFALSFNCTGHQHLSGG